MSNTLNNPTRFAHKNIRNRARKIALDHGLTDTVRVIIHNEIEAAARFWFIQGGGTAEDFEKLFDQ